MNAATIDSSSKPVCKEDEEKTVIRAKMASIIQKYKDRVSTLPRLRSAWGNYDLCKYEGFWIPQGNWFPDSTASYSLELVMAMKDEFVPRPSTVFLASFQKSGTTWLKALAFAIVNRTLFSNRTEGSNLVHPLLTASPHGLVPMMETEEYFLRNSCTIDELVGTHLPYMLLPTSVISSGCRIVYICRDPKDVLVSYWHFLKKVRRELSTTLTLDLAFETFIEGHLPLGSCWDHVVGYRKASLERPQNVLFLIYEKLMKDPKNEIKKMAAFIGHPFRDDDEDDKEVEKIIELCSFNNLREFNKTTQQANKAIPNDAYFRKGEVADSVSYLTPDMIKVLDKTTFEKYNGLEIWF